MRDKRFMIYLTIMTGVFLFVANASVFAASVPRLSVDELKMHLGEADYTILDVRTGRDWASATVKISGAERVEPGAVDQWIGNYDKDKTIVLYCT